MCSNHFCLCDVCAHCEAILDIVSARRLVRDQAFKAFEMYMKAVEAYAATLVKAYRFLTLGDLDAHTAPS